MSIIRTSIILTLIVNIFFEPAFTQDPKANGYKGIWFTLGQFSQYGDKYSGGLGTYTSNHLPLAIYSKEADKTFFIYGGTRSKEEKHLLIMVSYYDHKNKSFPKPTIVYDKQGVDDPHDDGTLSIDKDGYIWVFISGRANLRPGLIYKSKRPYDISDFDEVLQDTRNYIQPWYFENEGFINFFTKYTKGRELYWNTSSDGITWTEHQKLAGMGGHYQLTNVLGNKIVTVFNYHPGGNVDKRTNVYLLQTDDFGKTWATVDGTTIITPVSDIKTPAIVKDYEAEQKLVYLSDLTFDKGGNPIILAVVSKGYQPGPAGDPRAWTIMHWKNNRWNFHHVTNSTHNYDVGSLYIEENGSWKIIGPTEAGPQQYGTGGEVDVWISKDEGKTWKKTRSVTRNSEFNHSYVRRPINAHKDFYAFWADGNPDTFSESRLYFTNKKGNKVWQMPYTMEMDKIKRRKLRYKPTISPPLITGK